MSIYTCGEKIKFITDLFKMQSKCGKKPQLLQIMFSKCIWLFLLFIEGKTLLVGFLNMKTVPSIEERIFTVIFKGYYTFQKYKPNIVLKTFASINIVVILFYHLSILALFQISAF